MSEWGSGPGGAPPSHPQTDARRTPAGGFDPRQPIGRPSPAPAGTTPARPTPARPPGRRGPTLITLGVLVLAAVVIIAGSLIANRRDRHAAPSVSPTAASAPSPAAGTTNEAATETSTPFTTRGGSGTLRILGHAWTTGGNPPPTNGAYLEVEIELSVDDGFVGYGPQQFSAFDSDSQSFTATTSTTRRPALGAGVLSAGQTARGWVSFDIDRSRTLVMLAGRDSQPVAALKVEG